MKRTVLVLALIATLASCGGASQKECTDCVTDSTAVVDSTVVSDSTVAKDSVFNGEEGTTNPQK